MHPARIAELLEPFLGAHSATISSDLCHSEKRSDEESAFLSPTQLQSISTYIDILARWNARINLTAIRNPEEIVTRHFGESLFAARHLFPAPGVGPAAERRQNAAHSLPRASRADRATKGGRAALQGRVTSGEKVGALAPEGPANDKDRFQPALSEAKRPTANDRLSVADIGSGAGFPGIPLKLWAPQVSLTLIESNHKKATFLHEVARALTLTDINIQTVRAEQLLQQNRNKQDLLTHDLAKQNPGREARQDFRPPFDVVTLRAVERFADVLPLAAALVAPGGRLALLIGAAQQAHVVAALPMFRWPPPFPVPLSKSRTLLIGTREPRELRSGQSHHHDRAQ
jgi:16S rRNA (guanine(527)-N(7))-methyltransferase RsmG